jgi:hypothetical protein
MVVQPIKVVVDLIQARHQGLVVEMAFYREV